MKNIIKLVLVSGMILTAGNMFGFASMRRAATKTSSALKLVLKGTNNPYTVRSTGKPSFVDRLAQVRVANCFRKGSKGERVLSSIVGLYAEPLNAASKVKVPTVKTPSFNLRGFFAKIKNPFARKTQIVEPLFLGAKQTAEEAKKARQAEITAKRLATMRRNKAEKARQAAGYVVRTTEV